MQTKYAPNQQSAIIGFPNKLITIKYIILTYNYPPKNSLSLQTNFSLKSKMKYLLLFLFSLSLYSQPIYDPYCLTNSLNTACSQCIPYFYLKNNICTKVPTGCDTYSETTGECITCLKGFLLINQKCEGPTSNFNKDSQTYSADGNDNLSTSNIKQTAGSQIIPKFTSVNSSVFANNNHKLQNKDNIGFMFLSTQPTTLRTSSSQNNDRQIKKYDASGQKVEYLLINKQNNDPNAIKENNNPYGYPPGFMDPYCQQYDSNNNCLRCAGRFFFNRQSGLCTPINNQCNTYHQITGICLSCYSGFVLKNGSCISEVDNPNLVDINCKQFDSNKNCIQCYISFIVVNNRCVNLNPQCKSYDQFGKCTDCYSGYILTNSQCLVMQQISTNPIDLCQQYNNGICISCSGNNTLVNGVCTSYLSLCQTTDSQNNCISCYPGYIVRNGRCIIASDVGCTKFDNYGKCIQCSKSFYFNGSQCIQANPLCRTYNQNSGACKQCYSGYILKGSLCEIIDSAINFQYDANCAKIQDGKCISCSKRFVMINGRCSPVNDYCNTYNQVSGDCTSCYGGFVLVNGSCYKTLVISNQPIQTVEISSSNSSLNQNQKQQASTINYSDRSSAIGSFNTTNVVTPSLNMPKSYQTNSFDNSSVIYSPSQTNQNKKFIISSPPLLTNQSVAHSQVLTNSLLLNNPCLLYDTNKVSCLRCAQTWILSFGNCLRENFKHESIVIKNVGV